LYGQSGSGKILEWSGVMSMNPDFTFNDNIYPDISVVNSNGDIVELSQAERRLIIFKRSGESRILCKIPQEEHTLEWKVNAMDIDADDNLYVITSFLQESDEQIWRFNLSIFDKNGSKKLQFRCLSTKASTEDCVWQ
jgi:phage-related protein